MHNKHTIELDYFHKKCNDKDINLNTSNFFINFLGNPVFLKFWYIPYFNPLVLFLYSEIPSNVAAIKDCCKLKYVLP